MGIDHESNDVFKRKTDSRAINPKVLVNSALRPIRMAGFGSFVLGGVKAAGNTLNRHMGQVANLLQDDIRPHLDEVSLILCPVSCWPRFA